MPAFACVAHRGQRFVEAPHPSPPTHHLLTMSSHRRAMLHACAT